MEPNEPVPVEWQEEINLSNTLYSPSFHVNLVSYGKLKKKGGKWYQERDWILDSKGHPVVSMTLRDTEDLWVFDEPVIFAHQA